MVVRITSGTDSQPLKTRLRVHHERMAKSWKHETTVEIEHPLPDEAPASTYEDLDSAQLLRLQFLLEDVDRVAQTETERRNRRDFHDAT